MPVSPPPRPPRPAHAPATDNGATPLAPAADPPAGSRTVEYHRPSRNSSHYPANTDLALGMAPAAPSANASPRIPSASNGAAPPHAPGSYRLPPGAMTPSRDSALASASASRAQSYKGSPSINPRYSTGNPASTPPLAANGVPPPRPNRAGTLPLDLSLDRDPSPQPASARSPASQLPPVLPSPAVSPGVFSPPTLGQPFAAPVGPAPGNPYFPSATAAIEKGMEDVKMSGPVGVGVPMGVVEPREKELPREPGSAAMGGRSRSGTGRSSKDKKSMFGFVSGTSLFSLSRSVFSGEEMEC